MHTITNVNQITCITQFELVYRFNPKISIDITSLPLPHKTSETRLDFAVFMSNLHESVKCKMTYQVVKYTIQANRHMKELYFEEVDLVLVRLRLGRFPPRTYNKLHARRGGPFKILMKLRTNAFLIDLLRNF